MVNRILGKNLAKNRSTISGDYVTQVRSTISFPADVYESLVEIAKQKKVSLAWVVREATEKYISEKWPLFRKA